MVTYLNRRNKQHVMMLALLAGLLPEAEKSLKLEKGDIRKNFRMAATFAQKGIDLLLSTIDLEQSKALIRAVKHNQLELVPDYSKFTENIFKESTENIYNIAEVAIEARCIGCKITDIEGCELRKAMINFDIPVFTEQCPDGVCPYYGDEYHGE